MKGWREKFDQITVEQCDMCQLNVANFQHEGQGQISALSFSENGEDVMYIEEASINFNKTVQVTILPLLGRTPASNFGI